jgi:hypothetical protein
MNNKYYISIDNIIILIGYYNHYLTIGTIITIKDSDKFVVKIIVIMMMIRIIVIILVIYNTSKLKYNNY